MSFCYEFSALITLLHMSLPCAHFNFFNMSPQFILGVICGVLGLFVTFVQLGLQIYLLFCMNSRSENDTIWGGDRLFSLVHFAIRFNGVRYLRDFGLKKNFFGVHMVYIFLKDNFYFVNLEMTGGLLAYYLFSQFLNLRIFQL